MKVNVEILTGTYLDPEVSDNATVKELKERIGTELKLPVKRLVFVVEDEEFEEDNRLVMESEDEMMLRDLGVRQDSRIYLIIKEPDSVCNVERSQGGEDDEVSSEPKSKGGKEEEEKAKIEDDDKSVKINEVEDRNEKVEQEKTNDEAIEGEEGDKKEGT